MEMLSNQGLAWCTSVVLIFSPDAISNRLLSSLPHYLLLSFVLLNKGIVGTQPPLAYCHPADAAGRDQASQGRTE